MIKVRILPAIVEGKDIEGHINAGIAQLQAQGVKDEDILEVYPYNANNQYYYTIITYRVQ